jgi:DeoR/GlpR family transcriptional regulator of sugar metabolism
VEEKPFDSFSQAERQNWITEYILEQGSLQVDELVDRFGVSRMTIHRDLDDLEEQGVLRKIRNGATAQPSNYFESDVRFRLNRQTKEKEAICKAALSFIEPGQAIFLDEATTLLPLVRLLPTVAPLTVITNFLPILNELRNQKEIHLIALGGRYLPRFDTFTGLLCEQSVQALHADSFFTSTSAVFNCIAYHPDQQIVRVKRAMMANTSQHFILLDHTKFGKAALYQLAELSEFERVIVDSGLDENQLANLRENKIRFEVAAGE